MDYDISANILCCKSNDGCSKRDNDRIWVKDLKTQTLEGLGFNCKNIDCYNIDSILIALLFQFNGGTIVETKRFGTWHIDSVQFRDSSAGLSNWYPDVFHVQ